MFNNDALDDPIVPDECAGFNGGVFSDARPNRLQPTQAALLKNMEIAVNGDATTRRGTLRLGAGLVGDGVGDGTFIQGLHGYNFGVPQTNYLMAVNGRELWHRTSGAWTVVGTYAAGALPGHDHIHVCMAQGTDKLYLTDLFSSISEWDGTTLTVLGSGGATEAPFGCRCIIWFTGRLIAAGCDSPKDTVAFSDILDATTWDVATQNLQVGDGDGEPVNGVFGWSDFNLIVFKQRSIYIINANPSVPVSDFYIKRITDAVGVSAWRTAAQLGNDVLVLTSDGVRSIARTAASDSQQDIGEALSKPVDDIIRRINPTKIELCHAISWKHRYILFLPLDSADYPNYALVFSALTKSWSGYWTGIPATCAAVRVANAAGNERLCFGSDTGYATEFMDYIADADETIAHYKDNGAQIVSILESRGLNHGDSLSPKTGLNYELEYAYKDFDVIDPPVITSLSELGTAGADEELDTVDGTPRRQAFDLQARGQYRDVRFRITTEGGKLTAKRIVATAFHDTVVLQS